MQSIKEHIREAEKIADEIRHLSKSHQNKKIRFSHGSTNSTRIKNSEEYLSIDISTFNSVIEVNKSQKYVLVEPNVPMDTLVAVTLQYGLLPPVVMEFPGITVGGAINGGALESSSFIYGQFNDTCLDIEIILGNGEIIHANSKKNSDLFYGISGSYGTFGFISLIKIKLIDAMPYVDAKFYPTQSTGEALSRIKKEIEKKDVHYIEGILFDSKSGVVVTGKLSQVTQLPVKTYSNANDMWFYEKAKRIAMKNIFYEELIPLQDYLFRYNRGAFWMGEYVFPFLHIPNNRITKFLLNPFLNTRKLYDAMHAIKHSQNYFIQDFYCPYEEAKEFIKYSDKKLAIYPIWLCPIKPTNKNQKLSPHYIHCNMIMDIGIWGQTKKYLQDPIEMNRKFEAFAKKTNSRKMLYAQTYYTSDEFWKVYDHAWYTQLRIKYKAEKAFPTLWEKVYVSGKYKIQKWKGAFKMLRETLVGKNINS